MRIPKSQNQLLYDLESQLKFLSESLNRLASEPEQYKIVAGILRVLLCKFATSQSQPLLLDLMDDFGVEYRIAPLDDLPLPLQMVDELEKEPEVDISSMEQEEVWAYYRSNMKSYSLREFVGRGLAVYVGGEAYSYDRLIRVLAEQVGVAHEDKSIDKNVVEMARYSIGGYDGHIVSLVGLGGHALTAGESVINKAASGAYRPQHFLPNEAGRFTLPKVKS